MWSERNTVGETTKYDGQMQRERKQKGRRDKSSPPPPGMKLLVMDGKVISVS